MSQIRVKHVSGFEPLVPKKSAFTIETEFNTPKQPSLNIYTGRRGGGKTVAIVTYLRKLMDEGAVQRVLLVTPTYESNKSIFLPLNIGEGDVIEPEKGAVARTQQIVEEEVAEWEQYQKDLKKWKEHQRKMQDGSLRMQTAYEDPLFLSPTPPKWKNNYPSHPVRVHIVYDDCLSLPVMAKPSSGIVNQAAKHRHIGKGWGCGITYATQAYAAQGGLSRVIRENCTMLCLFKQTHDSQIKKILEESNFRDDVDEERFMDFLEYSTSKPYGFLTIDQCPKHESMMYRSGFSEYLN